jgi:hypothetical protein
VLSDVPGTPDGRFRECRLPADIVFEPELGGTVMRVGVTAIRSLTGLRARVGKWHGCGRAKSQQWLSRTDVHDREPGPDATGVEWQPRVAISPGRRLHDQPARATVESGQHVVHHRFDPSVLGVRLAT